MAKSQSHLSGPDLSGWRTAGRSGRGRPGSLALAAAFGIGCLIPAVRGRPLPELACWIACASIGASLMALRFSRPARPGARALSWWLLFVLLGAIRGASWPGSAQDGPSAGGGPSGPSILRGIVLTVPVAAPATSVSRGGQADRILFTVEAPAGGRFRIIVYSSSADGPNLDLRPGDRVELRGRLLPPRKGGNPGERRFRGGPCFVVPNSSAVSILAFRRELGIRLHLARLRGRIHALLERLYSGDQLGLMLALILGDRRLLDEGLRRSLSDTGTFHFLAISGLHVGILLVVILRLPFPAGTRTLATLLALATFTFLTGASPPVLRASLMAGLHALSSRLGRAPRPATTLGWTALILLALDPGNLLNPGFQLSFVAVLGILTWTPIVCRGNDDPVARVLDASPQGSRERRRLRRTLRWLKRALGVAAVTTVSTAPLVLLYFGRIHPLGPLWTIVVYPLAALVLAGGLLSVLAGLALAPLGLLVAIPTGQVARLMDSFLALAAVVPGSAIYLPSPEIWQVVACYALLSLGIARTTRAFALRAGCALLLVALLRRALVTVHPRLIHFDVGEGSAALLSVPGTGSFLIDPGGQGSRAGDRLLRMTLASGARRPSGVFLSHAHDDHVSALPRIAQTIGAGRIWIARQFEAFPLGRSVGLLGRQTGTRIEFLNRGDLLYFPGEPALEIRVLYPRPVEELPLSQRANDVSLVLLARLGDAAYLCLGDLEEHGIARLLSGDDDLRADVLLLPHHGHTNRLLPALLRAVEPQTVIISGSGGGGGRENAAALEARGYRIFATWRGGAVVSTCRGGRWETRYWARPSG